MWGGECVDWNLIKVAVAEYFNFSSFDADEHLLSINDSAEFKCLLQIEADKSIHHQVIEFSAHQRILLCRLSSLKANKQSQLIY